MITIEGIVASGTPFFFVSLPPPKPPPRPCYRCATNLGTIATQHRKSRSEWVNRENIVARPSGGTVSSSLESSFFFLRGGTSLEDRWIVFRIRSRGIRSNDRQTLHRSSIIATRRRNYRKGNFYAIVACSRRGRETLLLFFRTERDFNPEREAIVVISGGCRSRLITF